MPRPPPIATGPLSEAGEKRLHSTAEIRPRRLEQEVQVITEDHERDELPARSQNRPFEVVEQAAAIVIVMNDALSRVAPRHDVIDRAWKFDPESSRHEPSRTKAGRRVQNLIKTLADPDCRPYLHFARKGQRHTSRGQRPRTSAAKNMSQALQGRHKWVDLYVSRWPVAPFQSFKQG